MRRGPAATINGISPQQAHSELLTIFLEGAAFDPVASSSTGTSPVADTVQNDSACGDLMKP
jgi:hypothetical protein